MQNVHAKTEFTDFCRNIEIYVKIILFRPIVKIAINPRDFHRFWHAFSWKSNFSLNFTIFTKNQLFHPKSNFYEKVQFSRFFERQHIFFENGPNHLWKTWCYSNISSLGRQWSGKGHFFMNFQLFSKTLKISRKLIKTRKS